MFATDCENYYNYQRPEMALSNGWYSFHCRSGTPVSLVVNFETPSTVGSYNIMTPSEGGFGWMSPFRDETNHPHLHDIARDPTSWKLECTEPDGAVHQLASVVGPTSWN